nr:protein DCL, chloroplastic [Ipomoea batatas]
MRLTTKLWTRLTQGQPKMVRFEAKKSGQTHEGSAASLHSVYHHQQSRGLCFGLLNRRLFCATTEPSQTPEDSSSAGQNPDTTVLKVNEPPRFPRWSELDYQKWKEKEAEILQDIKPVISLVKDIIHSTRFPHFSQFPFRIYFIVQLPLSHVV